MCERCESMLELISNDLLGVHPTEDAVMLIATWLAAAKGITFDEIDADPVGAAMKSKLIPGESMDEFIDSVVATATREGLVPDGMSEFTAKVLMAVTATMLMEAVDEAMSEAALLLPEMRLH